MIARDAAMVREAHRFIRQEGEPAGRRVGSGAAA
jgi:hypothetical protein